jgi:hypothetical protein
MMNSFLVGVALVVAGQVQTGPTQMQATPGYAPYAAQPSVASFNAFTQPVVPPAPAVQQPLAAPPADAQNACPAPAAAPASVRPDWLLPGTCAGCWLDSDSCCARFIKAYYDAFNPSGDEPDSPPAQRRALPEAWSSPPFPSHEFQGFPLVGVPPGQSHVISH